MKNVTKTKKFLKLIKKIDIGFIIAGSVCFIIFLLIPSSDKPGIKYSEGTFLVSSVGLFLLASQKALRKFFSKKKVYIDTYKREAFSDTEATEFWPDRAV